MKCVVTETCWPDGQTVWKKGQTVEVSADQYNILRPFLDKVKPEKIEKVVKDGSTN